MPWRVEGTAEAGVGWGMPGVAGLACAGMCPAAEGAGRRRVGRAGSPIARGRCGRCFTCGSRVAAIPPWATMRSHASVNALWRATTVCHSAPHMREWVPPAAMDRLRTHASYQSWPAKRTSPRRTRALMQNSMPSSDTRMWLVSSGEGVQISVLSEGCLIAALHSGSVVAFGCAMFCAVGGDATHLLRRVPCWMPGVGACGGDCMRICFADMYSMGSTAVFLEQ